MVANIQEGNGLEAWRRLNLEYNPETLNNAPAWQEKLLSMKACASSKEIPNKILEMEEIVGHYAENKGDGMDKVTKLATLY